MCPCPPSALRVTMPSLLMPTPWTVITQNRSINSSGPPPTPVKAPGLWVNTHTLAHKMQNLSEKEMLEMLNVVVFGQTGQPFCVCRRCWRSPATCWRWAVRWKPGNVAGSSWGTERSSTTNLRWVCLTVSSVCFLLRFCCLHRKHCTNISELEVCVRVQVSRSKVPPVPPLHFKMYVLRNVWYFLIGFFVCKHVFLVAFVFFSEWRDQETSGSDWAQLFLPYCAWRRCTDVSSEWKTQHYVRN